MTPAEFRVCLDRLGISQVRAAKLLGVNPSTIRRWVMEEAGSKRAIPEPVSRFLRFLIATGATPAEVDKALGE